MEKKKVMVVDDEMDFVKITKINLEMTGRYEVMTISNAKDIVAQVRMFKPDIILLDIIMPRIDGLEACKMLRNDYECKKIPIIILSALDTDKDKLMIDKLGVSDFLMKPIEKDDLISKIEKALQKE